VAVLGFIVFYLYALISFAMLRSSFDPENNLYCATLWQCTITVIRYGLIGDMFDVRLLSSHTSLSSDVDDFDVVAKRQSVRGPPVNFSLSENFHFVLAYQNMFYR